MGGGEDVPNGLLDAYLAALEAALAALPAPERRDILLETRSHVLERTARAPDQPVAAVLAELGPPGHYARQFLGGGGPPEAGAASADLAAESLAASRPGGSVTLRALAQLTTQGPRGIPLLLAVGAAYALATLALLFVCGELVDPAGTGVFVRERAGRPAEVSILIGADAGTGRDVLGRALLPIGVLLVAGIHLSVRAVVRRVAFGARGGPHAPDPTSLP